MHIIWKLQKAFVKDILAETTDRPHYNTLSTIVRNLEEKGYVSHTAYGNTHQYFPLISEEEYKRHEIQQLVGNYFDNSVAQIEVVQFITVT